MTARGRSTTFMALLVLGALGLASSGCRLSERYQPCCGELPRELTKVSLPTYVIEPPDVLLINIADLVPKHPYKLSVFDVIRIRTNLPVLIPPPPEPADPTNPQQVQRYQEDLRARATLLSQIDISGIFSIGLDGQLDLGPRYGTIEARGQDIKDIKAKVERLLKGQEPGVQGLDKRFHENLRVTVELLESRGLQDVAGEHLVRMDGTVGLGIYGDVYVTGLTRPQAKAAIEEKLKERLQDPEIDFDVSGYNSKVYYIVVDGLDGAQVTRLPMMGYETVLDVMALFGGVPAANSKFRIFLARPSPPGCGGDQVLPIDWYAITKSGATATNYQILPGDRIYIQAQGLLVGANFLNKVLQPVERFYTHLFIANSLVQQLRFSGGFGGGGFGNGFGNTAPLFFGAGLGGGF